MTRRTILYFAANPRGSDQLALPKEARAIQAELERNDREHRFELLTRWAAQPLDLPRELDNLRPAIVHFSGHGRRGGSGEQDRSGEHAGPDDPGEPGEPGEHRPATSPRRGVIDETAASADDKRGPVLEDHDAPPRFVPAEEPRRDIDDGTASSEDEPGLVMQGDDDRPRIVPASALAKMFEAAEGSVRLVVLNACFSERLAEALLAHADCVVGMSGEIGDDAAISFACAFYGTLARRRSVADAFTQGCAACQRNGRRKAGQLRVREGIEAKQLILADPDRPDPPPLPDPAPRRRGWRWRSTVESAEAGDLSVLAFAEAIAASAVYLWIALRFGTLLLTISTCVALFLLLRTPCSAKRAWRWYLWRFPLRSRHETRPVLADHAFERAFMLLVGPIFLWMFSIVNAVQVLLIRFGATAFTVVMHPLSSVAEIPRNWWHAVASIDSFHPVELLPGSYLRHAAEKHDGLTELRLMPWRGIRLQLQGLHSHTERLVLCFALPIYVLSFLLPALLYRWSLKGTALILSPLAFIVQRSTARPLHIHLEDIRDRAHFRHIRKLGAALVLLLLIAKACLAYAGSGLVPSGQPVLGRRLLELIVMPDAFPPWQITGILSAFLVWVLYLFAEAVIGRWDRNLKVRERAVEVALRCLSLVSWSTCAYTIGCCIYLVASASGKFDVPPMGTGLLPWQ